MPELPEVATVVRGLEQNLPGRTIKKVEVFKPKQLVNISEEQFLQEITAQTFREITRFGKYIFFHFTSGKIMAAHLRMTGKFIFIKDPAAPLPETHIRIRFYLEDGTLLLFQDMRIFGTIAFYLPGQSILEKNKVGLDPFDSRFTAAWLTGQTKKRRINIKTFLLDQKVLAGLGNIYVCEALFDSAVSPLIPANRLKMEQAEKLIVSIRKILTQAIQMNGTSVSDYRTVEDKTGEFQNMLKVYQKEGTLCRVCQKGKILRIKQNQRSTFYCPVCQNFDEENISE